MLSIYKKHWLFTAITITALAWVLYAFGLRPALDRLQTLKRVIPENRQKLAELQIKSKQYLALAAEMKNMNISIPAFANAATGKPEGQKDFELVAFLELNCKDAGLAKKVTSMKQLVTPVDSKYSETAVEIQLDDITLQQLVEFLIKAQSSNQPLWVKSLYIKKSDTSPNLIAVTLQLSSFKPNPV